MMFSWELKVAYTRAKSRDRRIVKAQKKVSKGRPNSPPKSCSVVTDPKCRDREIVRPHKKVSKGCPNTPPTSCSVVADSQV